MWRTEPPCIQKITAFSWTTNPGITELQLTKNPDPKGFFDCIDFRGAVGVVVGDAVAGYFPLLKTKDGGRTWAPYSPPGAAKLAAAEGEGAFAASGTCVVLQPDQSVWVGTAKAGRVVRFGTDQAEAFEPPMLRGGASEGISTLAFRNPKTGPRGVAQHQICRTTFTATDQI